MLEPRLADEPPVEGDTPSTLKGSDTCEDASLERTALDDHEDGYSIPLAPLPPWLQSPEDELRWKVCAALSIFVSAQMEPDGRPDSRFVWFSVRALYHDARFPTGEAEPQALEELDKFLRSCDPLTGAPA